eukprot:174589-Chlamydomonas_euryale.AAC.1
MKQGQKGGPAGALRVPGRLHIFECPSLKASTGSLQGQRLLTLPPAPYNATDSFHYHQLLTRQPTLTRPLTQD